MSDESNDVLANAIARNLGLILSLPSAGMLRHHKSRFLGECPDGIWIESAPADFALIDELIAHGRPAALSFKIGSAKASFVATVLKRDPEYQISDQVTAEALLIRRPENVKSVQRRSNYRVRVRKDTDIRARIWRISEQADLKELPMSYAEVPIELRDLSISGLGMMVTLSPDRDTPLVTDSRLRIELTHEGVSLILDGRLRHMPTDATGNQQRIGVQFKKLEDDLVGRQSIAALTRIVGNLQREEARRLRMGLAEAG
ncbi:hypothetical protein BH09PLA1_BH09PLA1_00950 [soil metagenome]